MTNKVRWTSNAVYSLNLLGLNPQSKQLQKAINWLKHIPKSHPEWYLRIKPLIAVGLSHWLDSEKDLQRIQDLFEADSIGPLSIKVALALELLEEGVTIPKLDLIEKSVMSTLRKEESGLYSFAGSTNDTTLYCNFLSKIDHEKYHDIISCCVQWIIVRRIEDPHLDAICWEESYGKTAYVILNLLKMRSYIKNLDILIPRAIAFFRPKQNGAIPEDVIPAHDSKSSLYTTILFIRVCAAILQEKPIDYRKAFGELISETISYRLWLVYKFRVFGFWGVSLVSFTATGGLLYFVFGKQFVLSVAASAIAGMFPWLYLLIKKLYPHHLKDGKNG